jgi:formylmethanofuran dehydrogenase subunit E
MTATSMSPELIKQTTDFHGHWCPGLAIGIRAAEWALRDIGKAGDEEIVALVETDMCGVDAIQYLTGCTFGKGNLIYQDYGKNAFTFYRRGDGKAIRLVARPVLDKEEGQALGRLHKKLIGEGLTDDEESEWHRIRADYATRVMDADLEELFELKEPTESVPKKARILSSLVCEQCNELVMESRTRRFQEQTLCIPCFEAQEQRK